MKLKKIISSGLALYLIFNNISLSLASTISEDGRYETFEGSNIIINNVLEEDKVNVKIEGNTFSNIVDNSRRIILNTETSRPHDGYISVDVNLKYPLKANTKYTIYFNVTKNPYNHPPFRSIVLGQGETGDTWSNRLYWDNTFNYKIDESNLGACKATFITSERIEETSFPWVRIIGEGWGLYDTVIEDFMIFEGDTPIASYFEGMKSVGQDDVNGHNIEIISQNKNLFKGIWEIGDIDDNGKEVDTIYNHVRSDYIEITPGLQYICSNNSVKRNTHFYFYDSNKKFISKSDKNSPTNTFVAPNNAKYVRLNGNNELRDKFQLELGDKITEYVDRRFKTKKLLLSEPLRGLPNGIKDRIIKKNGQWIIERNLGEVVIDGNKGSFEILATSDGSKVLSIRGLISRKVDSISISDKLKHTDLYIETNYSNLISGICTWLGGNDEIRVYIKGLNSLSDYMDWIKANKPTLIYQLKDSDYESLNIDSTLNTYLDVTHILNNSIIPCNMKVTIDRTINRAMEAIQIAKENPMIENITNARYWTNLLKESIKKDELNNEINNITNVEDLVIEKKMTTSNVDLYIKPQNSLLMSLSTNSIIFDEFDNTEDMEKLNAVDITIESSLPYRLNSYLTSEIKNKDGSNIIPKEQFNIRLNGEANYKAFDNVNEKLVLKDDCLAGVNNIHSVDLILRGGRMNEADIYKTTLRFEVEQK